MSLLLYNCYIYTAYAKTRLRSRTYYIGTLSRTQCLHNHGSAALSLVIETVPVGRWFLLVPAKTLDTTSSQEMSESLKCPIHKMVKRELPVIGKCYIKCLSSTLQ